MDDALVVGAAATGALVCAYLTLGTAVTLADATGRFSRRWVPVWWRGAVSAAFSVGLTATLVAPASAVSSGDDAGWVARPAAGKVEQSTPVRDSWLAGKSQAIMTAQGLAAGIPTTPLAPAEPTPNGQPAGAAEGVHVVVTGDTLWDITATYLGENASDTEIASAWPQLYQLNRDVIGDDPGVILPRQVLALPTEWQS
jgi:nucleoid-associated protein YgaU